LTHTIQYTIKYIHFIHSVNMEELIREHKWTVAVLVLLLTGSAFIMAMAGGDA
jgi:hypothetical protein